MRSPASIDYLLGALLAANPRPTLAACFGQLASPPANLLKRPKRQFSGSAFVQVSVPAYFFQGRRPVVPRRGDFHGCGARQPGGLIASGCHGSHILDRRPPWIL